MALRWQLPDACRDARWVSRATGFDSAIDDISDVFTCGVHLWYSRRMMRAFVGVVGPYGLESFHPEYGQELQFLERAVARRNRGDACCFWAVTSELVASRVRAELSCGWPMDALFTLQTFANDFGCLPPPDHTESCS